MNVICEKQVILFGALAILLLFTMGGPPILAFQSPDCESLQPITVQNATELRLFHQLNYGAENWIYSVSFDPTGEYLAIGRRDGVIIVVDAESWETVSEFETHSTRVSVLDFSHITPFLLASGNPDGSIEIWSLEENDVEHLGTLESQSNWASISDIDFHPTEDLLASATSDIHRADNAVRVWDLNAMEEVAQFPENSWEVTTVAFSPDGTQILSSDSSGRLLIWNWNLENERPIGIIEAHANWIRDAKFSPDGSLIASVGRDRFVRLWDAMSYEPVGQLDSYGSVVYAAVFNEDGSILATGNGDGVLQVWEIENTTEIISVPAHNLPIIALAFEPGGGSIVTGSTDGSVRFWGVCQ